MIKQVVVMRTKYPDGKGGTFGLRVGKLIAQGSHSSMAFLVEKIKTGREFTEAEQDWLNGESTKICLKVEHEEELLDVFQKARLAGLEAHLITDLGKTEFHGVPTNTAVAIGPDFNEKIDQITGNLSPL